MAAGVEAEDYESHTNQRLWSALKTLDERSQDIVKARWLEEDKKTVLQELADKYSVSAECVHQLEANAMKALRAVMQ